MGTSKVVGLTATLAAGLVLSVSGSALAAPKCSLIIGASENPPVVSEGSGRFRILEVTDDAIAYRLRYDIPDPDGVDAEPTTVLAAHIHVANPGNNGPVAVFLCGGGGARDCPSPSGRFEGRFEAGDVITPVEDADGTVIIPDDSADPLGDLLRLIRDGATYVNVHTNNHTFGEIRCQINARPR